MSYDSERGYPNVHEAASDRIDQAQRFLSNPLLRKLTPQQLETVVGRLGGAISTDIRNWDMAPPTLEEGRMARKLEDAGWRLTPPPVCGEALCRLEGLAHRMAAQNDPVLAAKEKAERGKTVRPSRRGGVLVESGTPVIFDGDDGE